jgi:hypothetical protein
VPSYDDIIPKLLQMPIEDLPKVLAISPGKPVKCAAPHPVTHHHCHSHTPCYFVTTRGASMPCVHSVIDRCWHSPRRESARFSIVSRRFPSPANGSTTERGRRYALSHTHTHTCARTRDATHLLVRFTDYRTGASTFILGTWRTILGNTPT